MNIRKRRSDRSGRVRLFSPGRPPVAGREERRRFWAAIAAGTASEDAAVGVGVPQAVGTRWFRKAGGMPPSMFRAIGEASLLGISLLRSGRRSLSFAFRVTPCRRLLVGSGGWHRQSPESCGATPPPASGGLEYRATTAQCGTPKRAARRPKRAKLARNAALRTYVEERLAGVVVASERELCSRPGRVLEKPSARTTPGPVWAMGETPEPGADRPSPAGGLPGRRDHAHQP